MKKVDLKVDKFSISSVNAMLIPIKTKGGKLRYKHTPKYRKTMEDLALIFKSQLPDKHKPFVEVISVFLIIETAKDIDNCTKIILDAMQYAGVLKDDKDIMHLSIDKNPVKIGKPETLRIRVFGFAEEDINHGADSEPLGKDKVSIGGSGK